MSNTTMQVPPQRRGVEFRASSFDEAENTIEVVFTTGATVRRNSWWDGPYDEELVVEPGSIRLERLNAGAPFLNSHDSWDLSDVIGSIVPGSARIEGGIGVAKVLLSRAPGDADNVQKIRDGIVRNISVGYRIHKVEKTEADDGSVPVWRVVDWEPLEVSAVPIPADPGAQVRSADDRQSSDANPCIVIRAEGPSAAQSATHKETAMSNRTNAAADETRSETDTNAPPAPINATATEIRGLEIPSQADIDGAARRAAEEAVRGERERSETIRSLAAKAGQDALGTEHVRLGTSVDAFRGALLDAMVAAQGSIETRSRVRVDVSVDESQKRGDAIENAILHRADPQSFQLSDAGREFRGMSLIEIARDCLEARGTRSRGLSKLEVAQLALEQRSGLHSTADFPAILANVANKTLRAGYEAMGQTFRPLVRETTVSDFKEVSRVQLGEAPSFEKVNEHGEFTRGTVGEGVEKYSIATYGRIVGITRQVIVNDDLQAFSRIPRAFGVQAAQLESDLVWAQILGNPSMNDGVALFHATHGNLAGSGAAIGIDSIGAGRLGVSTQKGLDGKTTLNLDPKYLIVPKALQTKAEQFIGQIFAAKTADQVPESLRSLTIISEPRLDNGIGRSNIAGSATAWYLAADGNQVDLVELAYLEGQRGVFTETRQGFDVDGVEIKVRLDVGAKTIDWRGFWKNPGA